VRARARKAGIAVDWVECHGPAPAGEKGLEALRRILDSLDVAQDSSDVRPLVTARVDVRIELPGLSSDADMPAELVLEDGQRPQRDDPLRQVRDRARDRQGGLPPPAFRWPRDHPGRGAGAFASPSKRWAPAAAMWGVAAQCLRPAPGPATAVSAMPAPCAILPWRRPATAPMPWHSARCTACSPPTRRVTVRIRRRAGCSYNPLYSDPSLVFGPERLASHAAAADEQAPLIDWLASGAAKFARLRRLFDDFVARDLAAGTALAADFERFVREGGGGVARACAVRGRACDAARQLGRLAGGRRHPADTAVADYLKSGAAAVRYHLFLQWITAPLLRRRAGRRRARPA